MCKVWSIMQYTWEVEHTLSHSGSSLPNEGRLSYLLLDACSTLEIYESAHGWYHSHKYVRLICRGHSIWLWVKVLSWVHFMTPLDWAGSQKRTFVNGPNIYAPVNVMLGGGAGHLGILIKDISIPAWFWHDLLSNIIRILWICPLSTWASHWLQTPVIF